MAHRDTYSLVSGNAHFHWYGFIKNKERREEFVGVFGSSKIRLSTVRKEKYRISMKTVRSYKKM